jgi:hypothetical protein
MLKLHETARALGKLKVDMRELQAAARRDPFAIPEAWNQSRDWYRIVQTI